MNAFPSSIWETRRELLVDSLTGVVPAACDAEAGEPEEVVLDRAASPHEAPPSATCVGPRTRFLQRSAPEFNKALRRSVSMRITAHRERSFEGDEQFGDTGVTR